jgi:hypothetical protein
MRCICIDICLLSFLGGGGFTTGFDVSRNGEIDMWEREGGGGIASAINEL